MSESQYMICCCWVSCTDLKGAGEIERRGSRPQRFLGNGFLFGLASDVCNLFIRLGDITSGVCDTRLLQRSSFIGTIAQMGVKCSHISTHWEVLPHKFIIKELLWGLQMFKYRSIIEDVSLESQINRLRLFICSRGNHCFCVCH